MAQDNHIKVVTGSRMVVDTNGGTPPVYTQSMPNMEANYSTVTMTADIPQTWGATTYAKGDVLFWSDGFYVRDSTGNTMNGWSSGDTGGIRALPQSVIAVRVPDNLATTVTDGEVGQFYWLFFNGWSNTVTNGVRVGLVNMAGNGGLGSFVGWASSGE